MSLSKNEVALLATLLHRAVESGQIVCQERENSGWFPRTFGTVLALSENHGDWQVEIYLNGYLGRSWSSHQQGVKK